MATRRTSSSLTSAMKEKLQHTKLDKSKESLSLSSILQALDGPMTEEDAWAILYQSAKTAFQCFNSANPPRTTSRHNNNNQQQSHQQQHANNNIHNLTDKSENEVMKCVVARETFHIWIHHEGHVHPHSFQAAADSIEAEKRTVAEREEQLLEGLGITIFDALDYGWETDTPERNLSPDLKQMVDFLVWADSGEAEDSAAAAAAASVFSTSTTSSSSASPAAAAAAYAMKTLSQVMDRCRMHISSKASSDQADALSKINCRKLVADTLRLPVKFSSAAAPPEAHPPPRPTPPAPPEAPTAAWHDSKELKRTGYLLLDNRTDGQQYIHMQELLAVREERLKARERQIADIQKEEESRLKEEIERVREELHVQKELNEQQQKASSKAFEACDVMEKELQCLFCSELMVFATSLNCMHTFCQHCIREWKKQKCHGGSGNSFKRI